MPRTSFPVNDVNDLDGFLERWFDQSEIDFPVIQKEESAIGNVNIGGSYNTNKSYLLTKWHPSFEDHLEGGVRELVVSLIQRWGCITYSSCEGHRSVKGQNMRPRNVRILAESEVGFKNLILRAKQLGIIANSAIASGSVYLAVEVSKVTDRGLSAVSVDLVFRGNDEDEARYWTDLEFAYQSVLAVLSKAGG